MMKCNSSHIIIIIIAVVYCFLQLLHHLIWPAKNLSWVPHHHVALLHHPVHIHFSFGHAPVPSVALKKKAKCNFFGQMWTF